MDIHSQTAQELFGDKSPEHRRLAKDINFCSLYGGVRLMPHQQDLLDKAREMTHGVWPGLRLDTAKTGSLTVLEETSVFRGHVEPALLEEVDVRIERKPRC